METQNKPPCKFGVKCYRKNPKHFELYSHTEEPNENRFRCDPKRTSEPSLKNKAGSFFSARMRQSILQFPKKNHLLSPAKLKTSVCNKRNNAQPNAERKFESKFLRDKKKSWDKTEPTDSKISRNLITEKMKIPKNNNRKVKTSNCFKKYNSNDNDCFGNNKESSNDCEPVQSASWVFINNESREIKISSDFVELKNKTKDELIKILFLVDMPPDFYSFYEFCKSVNENHHLKDLQLGELKLVGPFDILSGEINSTVNPKLFLCHWRFYYDPPEFQTVLAAGSGFHIGYWRDNPKENPVFLASNNPNKDCIFKIEAENIFGTVYHYLNEFIKNCDPFKKIKITKLQMALSDWANKNKFSLQKKSKKINAREKKVLSKTFHGAGIVVPVDVETELGYRPLIETDENLKKICKLIINASDESEKESLWENLQPLIAAANIANDECDFGNSLELGIDLFCMGSPVFHNTVEHLLSTTYLLLNRAEFEEIIKIHLKFRRKGNDMGILNFNFEDTLK